jgi:hypothetical protein
LHKTNYPNAFGTSSWVQLSHPSREENEFQFLRKNPENMKKL